MILIPWAHHISYRAFEEQAWLLGGIHLVRVKDTDDPRIFEVCHRKFRMASDNLNHLRCDVFRQIQYCRFRRESVFLLDYIVHWYTSVARNAVTAGALAVVLLEELRSNHSGEEDTARIPETFLSLQEKFRKMLHRNIGIRDLCQMAYASRASLFRMFRRYCHCSPKQWIQQERLNLVARDLRETDLPLSVIAGKYGFPDPVYCSKLFSRRYDMPPGKYRKRYNLFH